jgi:predicted GNAT family acetyltransferase
MPAAPADIRDVADQSRFVLDEAGVEAELVYRTEPGRLIVVHTGVPDALGGRGIGGRLVRAAIARARHEELTIVPRCPFARRWLQDHPDAAAGVALDWTTLPPEDGSRA